MSRGPYPDWLDELELEARASAQSLENLGKLPNGFTERCYPMTLRERAECRRLRAAMEAAVDVDTFVALARGDIVPSHRLKQGLIDYEVRRTQHRRRNGDGG